MVVLATALGGGFGGGTACLLDIEPDIVCGDGFIDVAAGEECEPSIPHSYDDACQERHGRPLGDASCDPSTCRVLDTIEHCAICGDDIADAFADEECDGIDIRDKECPSGVGTVRCDAQCRFDFDLCHPCGNGVLDEGEECDGGRFGVGDYQAELSCTLVDSHASEPFARGNVSRCIAGTCQWDRRDCDYCGNGKVDGPMTVDQNLGIESVAEICDGEAIDAAILVEGGYIAHCEAEAKASGLPLVPNIRCGDDCLSLEGFDPGEECCLPGPSCEPGLTPYPCCDVDDEVEATVPA